MSQHVEQGPARALSLTRRSSFLLALAILGGCSDPEAERRKAFVALLNQTLTRQSRRMLLPLLETQRTALGAYAGHYDLLDSTAVLLGDLIDAPPESYQHLYKDLQAGLNTVSEATALQAQADAAARLQAFDDTLAEVRAARDKLQQSADIKAVYDKVFTAYITEPAAAGREILTAKTTELAALIAAVRQHIAYDRLRATLNRDQPDEAKVNELERMVKESERLGKLYAQASAQSLEAAARYQRILAGQRE